MDLVRRNQSSRATVHLLPEELPALQGDASGPLQVTQLCRYLSALLIQPDNGQMRNIIIPSVQKLGQILSTDPMAILSALRELRFHGTEYHTDGLDDPITLLPPNSLAQQTAMANAFQPIATSQNERRSLRGNTPTSSEVGNPFGTQLTFDISED